MNAVAFINWWLWMYSYCAFLNVVVFVHVIITLPQGAVQSVVMSMSVCLSVCLLKGLENYMAELHQIVCSCCLCPYLSPPV